MHNAALAALTTTTPRFADWRYFRFEIHPDDLPRALELFREKKFHGLNLTVPHKIIAFDRIAAIDPAARPIGAVNTLLLTPAGWRGHNTDGYGLAAAIRENLGLDLAGAHVILLGAGGAARGAAVECLQRRCASLWIANRTAANLTAMLSDLAPLAAGIALRGFAPGTPPVDLPSGTLVINATSAGLRPTDDLPVDLTRLPNVSAVFDMIYNPPQTPLLARATSFGLPSANGLAMLVHQGAKALEIWTDVPAATTAPIMAAAARTALAR
jgi:shikimate dehydrogenase